MKKKIWGKREQELKPAGSRENEYSLIKDWGDRSLNKARRKEKLLWHLFPTRRKAKEGKRTISESEKGRE